MNALVNKFVLVDSGEAYRTGEIVASIDDHFYMVRFDNMSEGTPTKHTTLVCLHEMSSTFGDDDIGDIKAWHFFDSRADLKEYVDWLDEPAEPEVVKLVPKSKPATH